MNDKPFVSLTYGSEMLTTVLRNEGYKRATAPSATFSNNSQTMTSIRFLVGALWGRKRISLMKCPFIKRGMTHIFALRTNQFTAVFGIRYGRNMGNTALLCSTKISTTKQTEMIYNRQRIDFLQSFSFILLGTIGI